MKAGSLSVMPIVIRSPSPIASASWVRKCFPGRTFKELPADHPIYTNENFQAKSWVPVPRLEGLDNGARMQMLLIPTGDPAKLWQTQSFPVMTKYPAGQLMMNIYLYAVDKQGLRTKGDTFIVHRRESVVSDHPPVKIARLQYDGNWNPEPGGWVRIANYVHNHNKLDITVEPVELGKGLLNNDYKLADLTGTEPLKLDRSAARRAEKICGWRWERCWWMPPAAKPLSLIL